MTSQEIFKALDEGMAEVAAKLASAELDGAGRYWTDEELAAGEGKNGKLDPVPINAPTSEDTGNGTATGTATH
jgi:hypothetical protein